MIRSNFQLEGTLGTQHSYPRGREQNPSFPNSEQAVPSSPGRGERVTTFWMCGRGSAGRTQLQEPTGASVLPTRPLLSGHPEPL